MGETAWAIADKHLGELLSGLRRSEHQQVSRRS